MLYSDIPVKFLEAFAQNAGPGYVTYPIPLTTVAPGRASLDQGFPTTTFIPEASGGNPPFGADMNGILYQTTAWLRYAQAGGFPNVYDSAFSTAIGGYPQGALLRAATIGNGKYWISTVDNNTSNPDSGGANWTAFPDLAVQKQKPNYAVATGATNAYVVALSPATSFSDLVGAPIRFKANSTNSITAPTVNINGSGAAVMINSDGTALGIGQIVSGCVVEGIPRDDGKFQVNSPIKATTASTAFVTGCIYIWPNETAPAGTMECDGRLLNISAQPNLYAILGTRYGGDGVTTFRLPDLRGEFIRGWNHGRGLDPGASLRTNAGGGLTGDHVGTNQLGAAGPINLPNIPGSITLPTINNSEGPGGTGIFISTIGLLGSAIYNFVINVVGNSGATETRPVNIYMMYVIAI